MSLVLKLVGGSSTLSETLTLDYWTTNGSKLAWSWKPSTYVLWLSCV